MVHVSTSAMVHVSTGLMAPLWAGCTTCFISTPTLCTKRRTTSRCRRRSAFPAPQTAIHATPQHPGPNNSRTPDMGPHRPHKAPYTTRNAVLRLGAVTVVPSQHRRRRFTPHHSIPAQTTPGPRTWDLTVIARPHTQEAYSQLLATGLRQEVLSFPTSP